MCGRFQALLSEKIMNKLNIPMTLRDQVSKGEVWSTNPVVVITRDGVASMRWGFAEDFFSGPLINAKSEKAWSKYYADSTENRRIVVPTTGFFEWKPEVQLDLLGEPTDPVKVKYLFKQEESEVLYLAGIYKKCKVKGEVVDCCSIFTTEPNDSMRDVHDRMPVILHESEIEGWLHNTDQAKEILTRVPPELTRKMG